MKKKCPKCEKRLSTQSYYKDEDRKDKCFWICKKCWYIYKVSKYEHPYPERVKAWGATNYAVRVGLIEKSKSCEMCGDKTKLDAHHEDYSQPLKVIWLCRRCHRKIR